MAGLNDAEDKREDLSRPGLVMSGLHLAALWSLAVLQPLLNLLGSTPEFFVARDNTPGQITAFVLLATILPPLVAILIEALLKLVSDTARWAFQLALVGLLFSTLCLVFLKSLVDFPAPLMFAFAIAAGVLLTMAYDRARFMRSLTDILVVAPLVILFTFFVLSDSSRLTLSAPDVEPVQAAVAQPAPVVMVIFDEFPVGSLMTTSGEVNQRRYPNFTELADTSDWYQNTTTDASYTTVAIPSIMTGESADRSSLPTATDHPDNLFTLLGASYDVHAVEPITQLCPDDICTDSVEEKEGFFAALGSLVSDLEVVEKHLLLPKSMTKNLPDISQTFGGFSPPPDAAPDGLASRSVERGLSRQWIDSRRRLDRSFDGGQEAEEMLAGLSPGGMKDGRPTLNFGHVEEPHYPWTDYPDGTGYGQATEDFRSFIPDQIIWGATGYANDRATQAHLLEVGYVDHIVGRIIERLKANGQWNKSLVVFTADHGGSLTPNIARREAVAGNVGQVATTPLFIKAPGQEVGRTILRPTCSTEILPKMAGILGVDVPWKEAKCDRDTVTVENGTGAALVTPFKTVMAQRQREIERIAALFGDETGWDSVLRLGPNDDLIGSPSGSLTLAGNSGISASPDQSGARLNVYQPGAEYNGILRQRGTLDGAKSGMPVAVSVNGTIAATGETFDSGTDVVYSVLLPQWALRKGVNDISIYEVDGTGAGRSLKQLQLPGDQ